MATKHSNRISGVTPEPATGSVRMKRTRHSHGKGTHHGSEDTTSMVHSSTTRQSRGHHVTQPHENTFKTQPDALFNACEVERLTETVLVERLRDVQYDPATCKELSQEMAAKIMDKVKSIKIKRYKLVAVVSIGSVNERPGMQFGSRCLWNQSTDSFASVKFTNGSLFAVAMVYGLYFE